MSPAILQMLSTYNCQTTGDYENALKEIIQEVALLGLWRSKFFEHAAFYGGSALRILHGLERFSEDLDFSLLAPDDDFLLSPYLRAVAAELEGFGFEVSVERKSKRIHTPVESAFIKAGTQLHFVKIAVPSMISERIHQHKVMTIKLEVDTDPPSGFETEVKTLLQPIPFTVSSYRPPYLFAGKIHAILQRAWKQRVKGRDYFDFVWYIARGIPCHLEHLEMRLWQSGGWLEARALEESDLVSALEVQFKSLDLQAAKRDVTPFLKDPDQIALWSNDFFLSLLSSLRVESD